MTAQFRRMQPDSKNMVVEACGIDAKHEDLLCVECGWEGHAHCPAAPWVVFKDHPCRLITESVSNGD